MLICIMNWQVINRLKVELNSVEGDLQTQLNNFSIVLPMDMRHQLRLSYHVQLVMTLLQAFTQHLYYCLKFIIPVR